MRQLNFVQRKDSHHNHICALEIDGEQALIARATQDGQNEAVYYIDIYQSTLAGQFLKTSMAQGADLERFMQHELLLALVFISSSQIIVRG